MKQLARSTLYIILIFLIMSLIILIPKESYNIDMNDGNGIQLHFITGFEAYKTQLTNFITSIKENKGFGLTYTGIEISEEIKRYMGRSIKLILPAFLIGFVGGSLIGLIIYYFRNKRLFKYIKSFLDLLFTIPDFFLLLCLQLILIKFPLFGLPRIDLYGHEQASNILIPTIILSIYPAIYMVRVMYNNLMLEESKLYMVYLSAKGMSNLRKIFIHGLWNSWNSILSAAPKMMIYILTSLPIIEIFTDYKGAAYRFLVATDRNEYQTQIAFLITFMLIIFLTVLITKVSQIFLTPTFKVDDQNSLATVNNSNSVLRKAMNFLKTKIKENWQLTIGLLSISLLLLFSILSSILPIFDMTRVKHLWIDEKLYLPPVPPMGEYPLGTDEYGRNLIELFIVGAKNTLTLIFGIVLLRYVLAFIISFAIRNTNSVFRKIISFWNDLLSYIPTIIFILIISAIPQLVISEWRSLWMIILIALIELGAVVHLLSNELDKLSSSEYVKSGVAVGNTALKNYRFYYLPHLYPKIIVNFTADLAKTTTLLAQLTIIGVFISQEKIQMAYTGQWVWISNSQSWMALLQNSAVDIRVNPWVPFWTCLVITLLIINFMVIERGLQKYLRKKKVTM
ncbi:ABC transporter permease subunit [Cytobacillus sp. IB215665]|uniref:ABC transporter permease subunit n=1 Tax=Cytobacillus sp. IB215665 TaxID=3097357 RepID=UPI002A0E0BDF|nr:ABC transporter permease subunit [Cytobacillus sp. IB215665]MDX8366319.1 ABC transporter permease subunit [Cytobacillus sp. IB215665]